MAPTRVLVVEDSATTRAVLCHALRSDPTLQVVGEASDGKEAIALCRQLRPDVITMDMVLPVMSGLAATEYIMAHFPTPILIVSASVNRSEVFKTYEALAAGAVDVMEKPTGREPDGHWERTFLATVHMVARIPVITHPRARLMRTGPPGQVPAVGRSGGSEQGLCRLAAVGASTGGPGALVDVLRSLAPDFAVPLLVVMHIAPSFGAPFADWLDGQTEWSVGYAADGQPLVEGAGRVLMAPPDRHLVVDGNRLRLTAGPERHSCRPSVDVLFESVAATCGADAVGCLLTGMGRDGAAGLAAIRRSGGCTIAQDEATSVVYGMPREAMLLGAAEHILPLPEIGPVLSRLVASWKERRPS